MSTDKKSFIFYFREGDVKMILTEDSLIEIVRILHHFYKWQSKCYIKWVVDYCYVPDLDTLIGHILSPAVNTLKNIRKSAF